MASSSGEAHALLLADLEAVRSEKMKAEKERKQYCVLHEQSNAEIEALWKDSHELARMKGEHSASRLLSESLEAEATSASENLVQLQMELSDLRRAQYASSEAESALSARLKEVLLTNTKLAQERQSSEETIRSLGTEIDRLRNTHVASTDADATRKHERELRKAKSVVVARGDLESTPLAFASPPGVAAASPFSPPFTPITPGRSGFFSDPISPISPIESSELGGHRHPTEQLHQSLPSDSVFASEMTPVSLDLSAVSDDDEADAPQARDMPPPAPRSDRRGMATATTPPPRFHGKRKVLRQRRHRAGSESSQHSEHAYTSDSSANGHEVNAQVNRLQKVNSVIATDLMSSPGAGTDEDNAHSHQRFGEHNQDYSAVAPSGSDANTDGEQSAAEAGANIRRLGNLNRSIENALNTSASANGSDNEGSDLEIGQSFISNMDHMDQVNHCLADAINTTTTDAINTTAGDRTLRANDSTVTDTDADSSYATDADSVANQTAVVHNTRREASSLDTSFDTMRAMQDLQRLDALNQSIARNLDDSGYVSPTPTSRSDRLSSSSRSPPRTPSRSSRSMSRTPSGTPARRARSPGTPRTPRTPRTPLPSHTPRSPPRSGGTESGTDDEL
jgi:DnaJ-domain-containing protein 1